MNLPPRRQVLDCASPLALSLLVRGRKSGRRGLPHSKRLGSHGLGLDPEGLLVAFQGFMETLKPVANRPLVEISQRHRTVSGNRAVVAHERLFCSLEFFQRDSPFDKRLRVARIERGSLVEA